MEEIIKKHMDKLYRTAFAILGRKADAEDIMQDAFVKLAEHSPHF